VNFLLTHPYALLPLFVGEEFGLPLPLLLSGAFTYVGFALSHGHIGALALVPVNILGSFLGASAIYGTARAGLAGTLWRRLRRPHILSFDTEDGLDQPRWYFPIFLGARMAPVPSVLVSATAGLLKVPYYSFVLAVVSSTLLWNLIFILGGVTAGLVAQGMSPSWGTTIRWAPLVVVWIGITVGIAVVWRRTQKPSSRNHNPKV